ncbi:hypothetical protein [Thiohalocapsa marina]|uniref:hypothetical protein n=1 Tax=Thiohalocapsa marina TaxID=424902 RepID=UPI0014784A17|nr:hypothetical protein [Thiohalocapsa marina]
MSRVCDELHRKEAQQQTLTTELDAAEDWLRRLRQALQAAAAVTRRQAELSAAEAAAHTDAADVGRGPPGNGGAGSPAISGSASH